MSYLSGFEAIQTMAQQTSSGSSAGMFEFISWDGKKPGGDPKILRVVSDAPIIVKTHQFIQCLDGKKRQFLCTSEMPNPTPCMICGTPQKSFDGGVEPARATSSAFGFAVLREESRDNGQVEYKSLTKQVSKSTLSDEALQKLAGLGIDTSRGEVTLPVVGVIQQSVSNFWNVLAGYWARYGTLLDRDYEISRQGAGMNTKYIVIPCDKTESMDAHLLPKIVEAAFPSLVQYVDSFGSPEYIRKHLGDGTHLRMEQAPSTIPTSQPAQNFFSQPTQDTAQTAPVETPQQGTQFGGLRSKLNTY